MKNILSIEQFEKFSLTYTDKEIDELYKKSLDDDYWNDISTLFPDYNSPSSSDCYNAIMYILSKMKRKYHSYNWKLIEHDMKKKILDGIT